MKYVIAGYSIAAISAARAIRARDADGEILAISDEGAGAYYRPLIPFLIGDAGRDINFTQDPAGALQIEVIQGRAARLDHGGMKIVLDTGEEIYYDRLLLATGGEPRMPAVPGLEGDGVLPLRKRTDAEAIGRHARGCSAAVVIGGGLVGVKAALALRGLGLQVTVVEMLEEVLAGRLDRRGGAIVRKAVEDRGIRVLTSETVVEIVRRDGRPAEVSLGSGGTIPAGVVIVAAGVRPATGWLEGSGLRVEQGLVVNDRMATSLDHVFGAGDIVQFRDMVTGMDVLSGLWSNAREMGIIAGANMAGDNMRCSGLMSVMNATNVAGMDMVTAGLIEPAGDERVFVDERGGSYRKLVFRDDVMVGAVFVGDIERAGIYVNLIRSRRPLPGSIRERAVRGVLSYADVFSAVRPLAGTNDIVV